MAEHHGALDPKFGQRRVDQLGLSVRRPDRAARPLAVTVSGAVERDHPIGPGRHVDQAAGFEILNHAAVPMQQDQRFSLPPLHVMQSNALHRDELASRWVRPFRTSGGEAVEERRGGQRNRPHQGRFGIDVAGGLAEPR